jgi:hypothetical protein
MLCRPLPARYAAFRPCGGIKIERSFSSGGGPARAHEQLAGLPEREHAGRKVGSELGG